MVVYDFVFRSSVGENGILFYCFIFGFIIIMLVILDKPIVFYQREYIFACFQDLIVFWNCYHISAYLMDSLFFLYFYKVINH